MNYSFIAGFFLGGFVIALAVAFSIKHFNTTNLRLIDDVCVEVIKQGQGANQ